MKVFFTKMHGLGNDFIVLDGVRSQLQITKAQIRFLADRHFGIGCDQLLLVERSQNAQADFRYRIFNSDGSEVEQCGNGARCLAQFIYEQQLSNKKSLRVETQAGIIILQREDDGSITVDMGVPTFIPAEIPFQAEAEALLYELTSAEETFSVSTVSLGNPHAVLQVDDVALAPVTRVGTLLTAHPRFPARANIGFMQILNVHKMKLRVWERGVGETLACGTGACAAAVTSIRRSLTKTPISVEMPGGILNIHWSGLGKPILMNGPATTVFESAIELPENLI